jgi:hypothetical protein
MDREEALGLLDAHLDQYRKLSYAELATKIGHEEFPEVVGPFGTKYQIEIQIVWGNKPSGDILVLGAVDDGGLRAFMPLTSNLLVKPDDHDLDDE